VDAETWRLDAHTLAPGQTVKLRLRRHGGRLVEGFVVNHAGALVAYVNACPHAGNPLDLRAEGFYSQDGRHLVCTEGPCPGARLDPLTVTRDGDAFVISCP
jgi:nitrite reductase/ring-hydroxylating ferredoxin subunit